MASLPQDPPSHTFPPASPALSPPSTFHKTQLEMPFFNYKSADDVGVSSRFPFGFPFRVRVLVNVVPANTGSSATLHVVQLMN
jgi:hypothetical protein